jgi:hypothetical protein
MVHQSIIVYRNPVEAAIWDGILPALPYLAMIALAIIVPVVLWTVIKSFLPKSNGRIYVQPYQGEESWSNKNVKGLGDL